MREAYKKCVKCAKSARSAQKVREALEVNTAAEGKLSVLFFFRSPIENPPKAYEARTSEGNGESRPEVQPIQKGATKHPPPKQSNSGYPSSARVSEKFTTGQPSTTV